MKVTHLIFMLVLADQFYAIVSQLWLLFLLLGYLFRSVLAARLLRDGTVQADGLSQDQVAVKVNQAIIHIMTPFCTLDSKIKELGVMNGEIVQQRRSYSSYSSQYKTLTNYYNSFRDLISAERSKLRQDYKAQDIKASYLPQWFKESPTEAERCKAAGRTEARGLYPAELGALDAERLKNTRLLCIDYAKMEHLKDLYGEMYRKMYTLRRDIALRTKARSSYYELRNSYVAAYRKLTKDVQEKGVGRSRSAVKTWMVKNAQSSVSCQAAGKAEADQMWPSDIPK